MTSRSECECVLTMRHDYSPKTAMFFTAFPLYLFMLLENFQSYDDKLCCRFIPKYIFFLLVAFIQHFLKMREHLVPFQSTAFHYTTIKYNLNFYHR